MNYFQNKVILLTGASSGIGKELAKQVFDKYQRIDILINTDISKNALTSSIEKHGVLDHNQEIGMTTEKCVSILLKAVENKKRENNLLETEKLKL